MSWAVHINSCQLIRFMTGLVPELQRSSVTARSRTSLFVTQNIPEIPGKSGECARDHAIARGGKNRSRELAPERYGIC
eukprot:scaffold40876_cov72-Phaeocystis_antarctica.AAC.2